MGINTALVVYTAPRSKEEKRSLAQALSALKDNGIKAVPIDREKANPSDFKRKDIVIAVGGDGTFLFAGHYLPEGIPLLGMNADIATKEGYFLPFTKETIGRAIEKAAQGTLKCIELSTLEASINGKKIPLVALNEFYIGSSKAYRTSRYEMQIGNIREVHRSSGVIAATSFGVNAWAKSALRNNIHVPHECFAYVVREPYERKVFSHYRLKNGILHRGEKITVISAMEDGIVVSDSLSKEFRLKKGDRVSITLSPKKVLSVIP